MVEKNSMKKLRQLLAKQRIISKVTQRKVAERLGSQPSVVSRFERYTDKNMSLKWVLNYCDVIGLNVSICEKNDGFVLNFERD